MEKGAPGAAGTLERARAEPEPQARAMEISVVIPTFNRKMLVEKAIRSALVLAEHAATEIIVVDDASGDDTCATLRATFRSQLDSGVMKLIASQENLGVTGAKNLGGGVACGGWIVFLDSDDELEATSLPAAVSAVREAAEAPLVFLRCVDRAGRLIGNAIDMPVHLRARDIVAWRWGECLPVVRRDAFARFPYDADLRGFEGLAYMRMMRTLGSALLLPIPARIYDQGADDRLSTDANMRARSCLLARGYWRALREFARECGVSGCIRQGMRIAYHGARCLHRKLGWTLVR